MFSKGLVCLAFISIMGTTAYGLMEFPVTTAAGWQLEPDISGSTVVWRTGLIGSDIRGRTLPAAEFPINQAAGTQSMPAIGGPWTVWMDTSSGEGALWAKNLSGGSETAVATVDLDSFSPPATSNGKAVWAALNTSFLYNIYYTDLTGGAAQAVAASTTYSQGTPVISGNNVAWIEDRDGTVGIYAKTLGSGTVYTVAANTGWTPLAIDGSTVVWQDSRGGTADIYGRNFLSGAEFAICSTTAEQMNPDISGNLVVWEDNRNGNWDIFGRDLATGLEFAVTTDAADQMFPAIDGLTAVWEDTRNDPTTQVTDIYGATIPEPATLMFLAAGGLAILARRRS